VADFPVIAPAASRQADKRCVEGKGWLKNTESFGNNLTGQHPFGELAIILFRAQKETEIAASLNTAEFFIFTHNSL
jgi:hypothetical protein